MEEFDVVNPEYVQGFNDGYLLAKHDPTLATSMNAMKGNSERIKGLQAGIEQYEKEQTKDRTPDFLKKDRVSSLDKSNNPSKGKGKDPLEREQ